MKRFGTEREIDLDDDDIEFITQQVYITRYLCNGIYNMFTVYLVQKN